MTIDVPTGFDDVLNAALGYAGAGLTVFPCVPGEKRPITAHGFLDATTDPVIIRRWWERSPEANVAIATGRQSGIVVADLDLQNGALQSLSRLPDLPATFEVGTGGGFGGTHCYLECPQDEEVRCSVGTLGPGIDIRGDGGYVVAPPSVTRCTYEVRSPLPLAPLPHWVPEQLRKPEIVTSEDASEPVSVDGPDIKEGNRNRTLFRIGAKLRGQGHTQSTILATLTEVNLSRCCPPLDSAEVEKIARSASQYPAGSRSSGPDERTLELIDLLEAERWHHRWANSLWSVYGCVLNFAGQRGSLVYVRRDGESIPSVRVSVSHRTIAERTGLARETVTRAVKKLRRDGWLHADNASRLPNHAGTLLLPLPPIERDDSKRHHIHLSGAKRLSGSSGDQNSPLRRSVSGVPRLGPGAGRVLEVLVRNGGRADKREIAGWLKMRTSNLTRQDGPLRRLETAEIVQIGSEGHVALSPDWKERLEEASLKGLEEEAAEVQRTKHELEREIRRSGAESEDAEEARKVHEKTRQRFHEARVPRSEETD